MQGIILLDRRSTGNSKIQTIFLIYFNSKMKINADYLWISLNGSGEDMQRWSDILFIMKI